MVAEVIQMPTASAARFECAQCGADASCNCGAPVVPKGQRIAAAIAANPELSNRQIAERLGVSHTAVNDVRKSGGKYFPPEDNDRPTIDNPPKGDLWDDQDDQDDRRIGKDGKSYPASPSSSQLIQQSLSNEHYTPEKYIHAARLVLKGIDLDPASCDEANEVVVATNIFTEKEDGLAQQWAGKVWLNPPYGRMAGDFVAKFVDEYALGRISAGIILVNAHCTDTIWFQPLFNGVLCFTDHRINFYGDKDRSGSTHGSVLAYFGPEDETFAKVFAQFGPIVKRFQHDDR